MHDPKLQEQASKYVQGLPKREGLADRFSRAELARHLVGFAEDVRVPKSVFLVLQSYTGDCEVMIDSVWLTADEAQARVDAMGLARPSAYWTTMSIGKP